MVYATKKRVDVMGNEKPSRFGSALFCSRLRWQIGLFLRALFRLAGHATIVLFLYVLLDFFLAFGTRTRIVLNAAACMFLAGCFFAWTVNILKITDRDAATRADRRLSVKRKPILSAFELENWMRARPAEAGLSSFLVGQAVDRAAGDMERLRLRDQYPLLDIGRQLRLMVIQVALVALMLAAHGTASRIILSRIRHPTHDIPPYSRYTFHITPELPEILYGGDAELTVAIDGAPIRSQVWLITRHGRNTHRTACFQESPTEFAQRLEKVVSPVEFCFAVGRARSKWRRVGLMLQPQIAMAEAQITPPPYSRRPVRRFFVGNEEFAALSRSKATLAITSNRPLLDGVLTATPLDGLAADRIVPGRRTARNTVEFEWEMDRPARIDVTIRDLRGTRNRDVLRIQQKILPDLPPEAYITHPGPFALATPSAKLPLTGNVTDDLGLRSVELVRTVVGYRDRIKPLGPHSVTCDFDFSTSLDLKALGTEPGQVLEFYLEAGDLNPTLMGIGASDVARVQIISEEEYAGMLRNRATLDQFMDRYNQAAEHVNNLKKALREIKKAAEANDSQASAQALEKARAAAEAAARFFSRLATDFPIYDIENRLAKVSDKMAGTMQSIAKMLNGLAPGNPRMPGTAEALLRTLGESGGELRKEIGNAKEMELVARVMECAGTFREIHRRQQDVMRRLGRFQQEHSKDMRLLAALGRRQDKNRRALEQFVSDLYDRAGKLPDTYRDLRSSAKEFADLVGKYGIPGLMAEAAGAAGNQDGRQAHSSATLALEALEKLMSDCKGGFGGMCRGQNMKFRVPKDVAATLAQMLASLLGQGQSQGIGQSPGIGAGPVGPSQDGFWMGGYSPMNMPVYGPSRMMFPSTSMDVRATAGSGSGAGSGHVAPGDSERINVKHKSEVGSRSMPLENVPEKYRNAVKRYFGGE